MRNYFNLILASLGLIVMMASCDCRGIDCQNGGTCNDGKCDCLKGYYGDNCELKDFCEINEVECVYGDCTDGICNCDAGYEGDDCGTSSRQKYLGEYRVSEEGCNKLDTLTNKFMYIEIDAFDPSRMILKQVFNYVNWGDGVGFYSSVDAVPTPGTNTFKIPTQEPDGNGKTISGGGVISVISDSLSQVTLEYTITTANNKTYECYLKCQTFIP